MERWILNFKRGLKRLARHEPQTALRFLREAITDCPVDRAAELARILFYTGIALKKIGLHDGAVQSWDASRKLLKNSPAVRHLKRFSNEYGMAKQGLAELDDWRAFYSLQLNRYLRSKKSRCIGTLAESDMIRDLISDAWRDLKASRSLEGRTSAEKLELFKSVSIVFPYFFVPGGAGLAADSGPSRPVMGLPACPCGSGLPYSLCCGSRNTLYNSRDGGF